MRIMGRVTCHIHIVKVMGKKFFHNKCISWSYRNRGYDARTHRKSVVSKRVLITKFTEYSSGKIGFLYTPKKSTTVRAFIIMMLAYSARKKRAKEPPAYSTLNPDTSSDSPSVRSKGARLVSARVEINHIMARGQEGRRSHVYS